MSDRPRRPSAPNLVRAAMSVRSATRVILGPRFSEGSRLLWRVVAKIFEGSAEKLAMQVPELDRSAVHLHLYGDRCPDPGARALYAVRFDVPESAWDRKPRGDCRLPALVTFTKTALGVLRGAGPDGLDIGALGKACAFARDEFEADFIALTVLYALRNDGLVERIPNSARWHLTTAGKSAARRTA